jgi:hypothetical protein
VEGPLIGRVSADRALCEDVALLGGHGRLTHVPRRELLKLALRSLARGRLFRQR